MTLTPEEGRRLPVLSLLERGRITTAQAAEGLGLAPRQVRRQHGPEGLVHGNRGSRSPRRLPDTLRAQIVALARGRYAGLNDGPLTEKLTTVEGLASPRRRRPPRHRSRRPRKAQAGLLCRLDGSPFAGFGPTEPACSPLAAIDDAAGAVLAATFRAQEDAAGSGELLRALGRSVGLPAAVYTDAHGIFLRHDTHWTLAEALQGFQEPTQVGRALVALGIHPIVAHRPVPRGRGLERVCAFHYARQVALDNTVRVEDMTLQLAPGPARRSCARATSDVVQCLDGSWRVCVADRLVVSTPAPRNPGQLRARKRR